MDRKLIISKINKVLEDMGGGMTSAAAGIVGIESLPKKKKVIKKYREIVKESKLKKI